MSSILNFSLVGLALAACFALYSLTYEVRETKREITLLERQIEDERDTIRTLRTEWALLNQPEHLQALAVRFLELRPVRAHQIAAMGDLPPMQYAVERFEEEIDDHTPPAPPSRPGGGGYVIAASYAAVGESGQ
jgi:hypothetical protein